MMGSSQPRDDDPQPVHTAWQAVETAEASDSPHRDLKVATALEEYVAALREHDLREAECCDLELRAKTLRKNYYQNELNNDHCSDAQLMLLLQQASGTADSTDQRLQDIARSMLEQPSADAEAAIKAQMFARPQEKAKPATAKLLLIGGPLFIICEFLLALIHAGLVQMILAVAVAVATLFYFRPAKAKVAKSKQKKELSL